MRHKSSNSNSLVLKSNGAISSDKANEGIDNSVEKFNTAPGVDQVDVESNTNSSKEQTNSLRTKLEQVEDFFNQHKAPKLKEISLERTQGFVEKILELED